MLHIKIIIYIFYYEDFIHLYQLGEYVKIISGLMGIIYCNICYILYFCMKLCVMTELETC